MNAVGFDYDTHEIRRRAKEIKACRDRVAEMRSSGVANVSRAVDGSFEGAAAQALRERLTKAQTELDRIYSDLNIMYKAVSAFAAKLEALDAELAKQM